MSGVYIKGMQMPSCCGECRFLDEYGDYPCCIVTDEQRGYNFRIRELRMPHCPLIPVPDHGRLIDADEFYKDINESIILAEAFKGAFNMWFDEQPTIIPADKEGDT